MLATALAALSLITAQAPAASQEKSLAAPVPDRRLDWFREARFGMFIHWGLYSKPGGVWNGKPVDGIGEWLLTNAQIPVHEYEPLQKQFDPVKFNAKEWARIAKDAGMKYLVITSKHHDGFCLWDSALTDWDVMGTPFKRDILKELSEACREVGIRFCLYHSIMDWHHPDYLPRRGWDKRPVEGANFDRYITYMKGQLKELVTRTGPLGILWFDGEWENTWTHEHGKDLYDYVRGLQPDIIINNRVDKGRAGMAGMTTSKEFRGDYGTPEQEIPARGFPGVDWESCMTMNDTWGFKSNDNNWKSATQIIHNLVDTASKGGNFLLNVGPTGEGLIPSPSVERLATVGAWLRIHGESIYGTQATPFTKLAWPCTSREGKLYLHLTHWPEDGIITLPGLRNKLLGRAWLNESKRAAPLVERVGNDVKITLDAADATDPRNSVLVLHVQGMPEADPSAALLRLTKDTSLLAADADLHGNALRYEADKKCIGYWINAGDSASWSIETASAGTYRVEVEFALAPDSTGSAIEVQCGESKVSFSPPSTGAWSKFQKQEIGELQIAKAGVTKLQVKALKKPGTAVVNLRSIRLQAK